LIPMLEKLTPAEQTALWRLFQNLQDDAKRDGAKEGVRQPWRHGGFR